MNEIKISDSAVGLSSNIPYHPITILLDNLRSAYNVGNIFRLADVCRIENVITCGYTAAPPHSKLKKTARGCDEYVPSLHRNTCCEAVKELKNRGYQIIGIETLPSAPDVWDVNFEFPVAFVFGNEAKGISSDTLEYCDMCAKLPVFGYKNSMNVSNCAAVVVYSAIQKIVRSGLIEIPRN